MLFFAEEITEFSEKKLKISVRSVAYSPLPSSCERISHWL